MLADLVIVRQEQSEMWGELQEWSLIDTLSYL